MPNVGKPLDDQTSDPAPNRPAASDSTQTQPLPPGGEVKGDMKTEEPLGWDQAPTGIQNPRQQRHPRPDGIGGLKEAPERKEDEKRNG